MKLSSAWISCILAVLIPICTALVLLYSDVQSLKLAKADTYDMLELKVQFTKQMTKNTGAIEALNETLKLIRKELK